jgi:hypothetical protein
MPTAHARRELDAHELRMVAARSATDPRSVRKVWSGQPMRSSVRQRIQHAIRALTRCGQLPDPKRNGSERGTP